MNVQRTIGLTLWTVLSVGLSAQAAESKSLVGNGHAQLRALDTLVGVKVMSGDAHKAGHEGEQRSGDARGSREVEGSERAKAATSAEVGTLTDLVIDLTARRITFAAVQTQSGMRALPIADLTFDATRKVWLWQGGEAALSQAMEFRAQRLDALHKQVVTASAEKGEAERAQHDASKATGKEPAIAHADSGRYALATDCAKREVHASDGRCATATNLVFELGSHGLAFVCAPTSHGLLTIPAAALQAQSPPAPGSTPVFSVAFAKDALRRVPHPDKDLKQLDDRAWRTKLYDAFLLQLPDYELVGNRRQ